MRFAVVAVAVVAVASACRRGEREPLEQAPAEAVQPKTFAADAELMFVYAGLSGKFETAAVLADVPEASRKVVRVIEPTVNGAGRRDYGQVYVVDLRSAGDELVPEVMGRREFERRALAALPPGQASRLSIPGAAGAGEAACNLQAEIILYGTSWCGACRQARTFLTRKGVAFAECDVEKDPGAAADLATKTRAAGISADRVPIIDVRGTLMVGFDASRLSTLIGDPI
jgi:glutaredoxin